MFFFLTLKKYITNRPSIQIRTVFEISLPISVIECECLLVFGSRMKRFVKPERLPITLGVCVMFAFISLLLFQSMLLFSGSVQTTIVKMTKIGSVPGICQCNRTFILQKGIQVMEYKWDHFKKMWYNVNWNLRYMWGYDSNKIS